MEKTKTPTTSATLTMLYKILLVSVEQDREEHPSVLPSLRERTEALSDLVDKLHASFERLDQEYTLTTGALCRLEQRFDRLEAERRQKNLKLLLSLRAALHDSRRGLLDRELSFVRSSL